MKDALLGGFIFLRKQNQVSKTAVTDQQFSKPSQKKRQVLVNLFSQGNTEPATLVTFF